MSILTVGIVTWNSEKFIKDCLNCLKLQTFQAFELIVVDNGSQDHTVEVIRNTYPLAKVFLSPMNLGFCGGHNKAIQESSSQYYMPYNPDIFADELFLEAMIEAIESNPEVGSVSGKLLRSNPETFYKTNIIDSTGVYFKRNRRSLDRGAESIDSGQYNDIEYVFGASGAAPLYRRSMLEDIKVDNQYFFENFFAYREDVDLAWRAQLKGWKCLYYPRAVAYHVRTNTPEKRQQMTNFVNMHSVKNRIMMLFQNESKLGLFFDGFIYLPYDILIIMYVLLKERTSVPALAYLLKNFNLLRKRRKEIQTTSRVNSRAMLKWFGRVQSIKVQSEETIKKNVFIIGSKGIPARYGGFETFVDQLTANQKDEKISYHVACTENEKEEFYYNNSRCFSVRTPNIGSAKAVLYDLYSLKKCLKYIKQNNIYNAQIYILACRIGVFFKYYKRKFDKLGTNIYVNPDGNEWRRSKWNKYIRAYWKLSEKLMIKHADLIICDSVGIEEYIQKEYSKYSPRTTFISYGTHLTKSKLRDDDEKINAWYEKHGIRKGEYFLIVGRFVPENNYALMIKEFMKSITSKDLVIISNIERNRFFEELTETTSYNTDKRIKWVGTVYDNDLLTKIREEAFGYLHGHEVGGTNPSLLEALSSTKINILLDVIFNREVGQSGALYFNKEEGRLKKVLEMAEELSDREVETLHSAAITRMNDHYSWNKIVNEYETLFVESRSYLYNIKSPAKQETKMAFDK